MSTNKITTVSFIKTDFFVCLESNKPDPTRVVQVFDFDDTITLKPENLDNSKMTTDEFFDAARSFLPDQRVVDVLRLAHSFGDAIAVCTSRPPERMEETIAWLDKFNIPFDQILLSTNTLPSAITKQIMFKKLQEDYKKIGMVVDDSPYNIEGARLQGIDAILVNKNTTYWSNHPESVYLYK